MRTGTSVFPLLLAVALAWSWGCTKEEAPPQEDRTLAKLRAEAERVDRGGAPSGPPLKTQAPTEDPNATLAGLALLDGEDLLLARGVVGQHLLVGHRAGGGHLELLEVFELVLHGVLEQYLGIALLDPREKFPEKAADRPG